MRVLQVNKFLYRRGGAESYMLDLSAALMGRGHAVEYWGMVRPENPPFRYDHLFVSETDFEAPPGDARTRLLMAGRLLYSPGARLRLGKVVDDFRPDVVHAHNVYHQLSPSVLAAAAKRGARVVMTLHDYKLACPVYRFLNDDGICEDCAGGRWYQTTVHRCTRGMLGPSLLNTAEAYLHHGLGLYTRYVDVFVAPSRFLADKVAAAGVPAERIAVVPNFADVDAITPRYEGEGVVFAGRLSPEKGVDTLVRAVAAMPGSTRLDVFGTGPQEAELRRLGDEVAPGRVLFHGRQPGEVVAAAMAAAAVVACPSEWYENCPMVVLEAMASGKAVVATALGGLPELVEHGRTGLLVPPGEPEALAAALGAVAGDPATQAAMGRAARARAEGRHRLADHVEAVVSLYGPEAGVLAGVAGT
ncbi:MAG: glycosyltransferase [Acidimicrobiia bacterium]